jgi:hypothetical protein
MQLFDIYKDKESNEIIQISSFANHINNSNSMIIVFNNIGRFGDQGIGSCPSSDGYGSKEEIEEKYELLIPKNKLQEYESWEEILDLVENKNK